MAHARSEPKFMLKHCGFVVSTLRGWGEILFKECPRLKPPGFWRGLFHGLKAPFDSSACAGSLRAGYGFLRRAASQRHHVKNLRGCFAVFYASWETTHCALGSSRCSRCCRAIPRRRVLRPRWRISESYSDALSWVQRLTKSAPFDLQITAGRRAYCIRQLALHPLLHQKCPR